MQSTQPTEGGKSLPATLQTGDGIQNLQRTEELNIKDKIKDK